ncbi:MAG: O-antigen ligase family protein [Chloroflexia bacterium]
METTQPRSAPAFADTRVRPNITAILRSDGAAIAGLFLAAGVFYLGPGLTFAVLGGALYLALALWKPYLTPVPIIAAASLFYRPRPISNYVFPLAEVLIVLSIAAWGLRDSFDILRRPGGLAVPDLVRDLMRDAIRRPFVWAAAGFLAVGVLALFLPHPTHRAEALREFRWTIVEPILFFGLIARYIRTERDILRVLTAFLVPCALNAQVGVDQYLFGDTWSMEGVGRAIGLYTGATGFGIFVGRGLAIAATLALFLPWADVKLRRWRWAFALLCVPLGLGMIFSFTRGAWVGVAVALVAVMLLGRSWRILAGFIGIAAAGTAAILIRYGDLERFSTSGSSLLSRTDIWAAALRVIRDHPWAGIGQDQFLYQDAKYGIPNTRFQTVSHPHDWVLDTWLRLGIWGLALMVATFAAFYWYGIRAFRGRSGTLLGALILALIAGMTDHIVHGFFDMAYFTQDLALAFWMLVGLMGAVVLMGRQEVKSEIIPETI